MGSEQNFEDGLLMNLLKFRWIRTNLLEIKPTHRWLYFIRLPRDKSQGYSYSGNHNLKSYELHLKPN